MTGCFFSRATGGLVFVLTVMLSLMMTRSPGLTDDRAPNGAILSTSHKWSDMLYQNGLVGGYSKIASSEPGVVYPPVSCAILYVARTLGDAVELPPQNSIKA